MCNISEEVKRELHNKIIMHNEFRSGLEFHSSDLGIVNCCGSYHNITVSGRDPVGYCSAYRPH